MNFRTRFAPATGAATLTAALLAACAGGSGVTAPPAGRNVPSGTKTAPAQFSITIPNRVGSAHARTPMFVSAGTSGLSVSVAYQSAPATIVGSSIIDLSASSPSCSTGTSGRTCSVYVNAPISPAGTSDIFTFTSYDVAPSGGAIPSGAKTLATGSVALTIIAGQTNTFDVALSGNPASVTFPALSASFAGDQGVQTFAVNPLIKDAAGQTIVGAFSAPVTIAASDNGSHTLLAVANGTPAAQLPVGSSTDASNLNARYDGNGGSQYSFRLSSGATSEVFNAMTVSGPPATYSSRALATAANIQSSLTVAETNFSGSFTQSNTCTNTAVVSNISQTGPTATLSLVGGLTSGPCTITISDGTLSYPAITVNNTISTSPLPLPTTTASPGGAQSSPTPLPLPTASGPIGGVTSAPSASPIPLPT